MKKISFIVLALSSSLAMFAQSENVTPMATATRFGIKAGVNMAKLRPSSYGTGQPNTNMKSSFHAGALVNIPLGTGGFAVQPEAMYSRQGSKMSVTTTVGSVSTTQDYEQDLGYVNIPVMLQWKSAGGFYVETGPQAGFLIEAQQEGPGNNAETENKENFKPFDFSWGAGLGFLSRIGLGIGARYNHGFRNVLDNDADANPSLRNSVINIGLSWHFGAAK
jgi:hypothetical protein